MSGTWKDERRRHLQGAIGSVLQEHLGAGIAEFTRRMAELHVVVSVSERRNELRLSYGPNSASFYADTGGFKVEHRGRRLASNTYGSAQLRRSAKPASLDQFIDRFMEANRLIYEEPTLHFEAKLEPLVVPTAMAISLVDVNKELLAHLARNPIDVHSLSSRKFEELIAAILKDFGFDVELTAATRDGGRDILAYIRNAVTSLLTFVECKRYSPHNKVGVEVVRQVYGVQRIHRANKSLIVTTSSFTADAEAERRRIETEMDLREYDDVVHWLSKYST